MYRYVIIVISSIIIILFIYIYILLIIIGRERCIDVYTKSASLGENSQGGLTIISATYKNINVCMYIYIYMLLHRVG